MFRQSRFESSHFLLTLAPFSEPKKKKKKECDLSLIALNSSLSAKKDSSNTRPSISHLNSLEIGQTTILNDLNNVPTDLFTFFHIAPKHEDW